MEHLLSIGGPARPSRELTRIRRVIAFADATGAPPEALAWLLRLSREAEARRDPARGVAPAAPAPLLVDRERRG
jgi:hypothetical protein